MRLVRAIVMHEMRFVKKVGLHEDRIIHKEDLRGKWLCIEKGFAQKVR